MEKTKKPSQKPMANEHWEKHYSLNKPSNNMEYTEGSDFNPKVSDKRKTVYPKVNREDH